MEVTATPEVTAEQIPSSAPVDPRSVKPAWTAPGGLPIVTITVTPASVRESAARAARRGRSPSKAQENNIVYTGCVWFSSVAIPTGTGYWTVTPGGTVRAFGDAPELGSAGRLHAD